jgi:hypothetical protein
MWSGAEPILDDSLNSMQESIDPPPIELGFTLDPVRQAPRQGVSNEPPGKGLVILMAIDRPYLISGLGPFKQGKTGARTISITEPFNPTALAEPIVRVSAEAVPEEIVRSARLDRATVFPKGSEEVEVLAAAAVSQAVGVAVEGVVDVEKRRRVKKRGRVAVS